MRTISETSDTRLLDALRDVNAIEALREKLMSDRSTQMPLEKKIPFARGRGVLTTFVYGDVRAILWVSNLACIVVSHIFGYETLPKNFPCFGVKVIY